jgi:hypothetical protein
MPAERSRRYEELARRAAAHERELAAEREREVQESEPPRPSVAESDPEQGAESEAAQRPPAPAG